MSRSARLAVLVAAALAAGALAAAADYQTLTLVLPRGEPAAGRIAFLELGCASCHQVAGDPDLPAPTCRIPGPMLVGGPTRPDPGHLATSVVAPSHDISPEAWECLSDNLSAMGDYSHGVTVRKLVDLVAYLESRWRGDGR